MGCPKGYFSFEGTVKLEHCLNYDDCQNDPCIHGICIDGTDQYTCDCVSVNSITLVTSPSGYDGVNCANNINDCVGVDCSQKGTCVDKVGSYTCDCNEGRFGDDCEFQKNYCEDVTCGNGGICNSGETDYTCLCPAGFTSDDPNAQKNCNININDCVGVDCSQKGTCVDKVGSYMCNCTKGRLGIKIVNLRGITVKMLRVRMVEFVVMERPITHVTVPQALLLIILIHRKIVKRTLMIVWVTHAGIVAHVSME
jgi:hypothetical protein